jgi:predicted metal-binding membrane protein
VDWTPRPHRHDGHRPERSAALIGEGSGGRERKPTPETLIAGAALLLVSALAWWWLAAGAGMGDMPMDGGMAGMPMDMPGMDMRPTAWTPAYALSVLLMWAIMMVAMMLPTALPMILLYARVAGQRGTPGTLPPTFVFIGAYVAVWTAFSALAAGAQWALTTVGVVNEAMRFDERLPGGLLLVAAGLYQLTPLKRVCLAHCRSPFELVTQHWRPGYRGALGMGLHHGAYCVGCCWFVMALLFVGGVMNLAWVAAIAAFVLAEKVLPFGARVGRLAGVAAVLAGALFVASSLGG